MVTPAGEAAISQIWTILRGKRDAAAGVWDDLGSDERYQLLLKATHNRNTAREYALVLWGEIPVTLYPKIRHALRQEIARAERFADALDKVQ